MHIPDGFIDIPTSLAAGVLAVGGVALCLRAAQRTMSERAAPLVGLTAAFIFAVQMLNFPVAAGTSGHLLGGALAAVLVGPWAGALAVTVVLIVQSLMFADGGLSAIGLNVINMGLVTVAVGWAVFALVRWIAPSRPGSVIVSAGLAAFVSVPAAALAFTLEYAIGGSTAYAISQVLAAMTGVHVLIGIGEGVITALTVAAVMATRPDMVHGAAKLAPRLDHLRPAPVRAGQR